jgi:hypothetical protein
MTLAALNDDIYMGLGIMLAKPNLQLSIFTYIQGEK